MKYLLTLLLLFGSSQALAAKMWVDCTSPTQNTDGSPLTNLAGFRVEWGSCGTNGTFGNYQAGVNVGPTVTRTPIYPTGLATVCARVFAINSANVLSASSNVASRLALPKLNQPTH